MIFDVLTQSHLYDAIHPRFAAAFDFLIKNDMSKFEDGKYELDGANLFLVVSSYQTKPKEEVKWECHDGDP